MKKTDLIWLAGFFDGEGCISIVTAIEKQKKRHVLRYRLIVELSQAKKEGKQICEWCAINFKGTVHEIPKREIQHLPKWRWIIRHTQARDFLKQIYPYLKLKKKHVKLAFEMQKELSKNRYKSHPSEIEKIEKYSYYEVMKQEMGFLNVKGRK
jgi:hypothetical protein